MIRFDLYKTLLMGALEKSRTLFQETEWNMIEVKTKAMKLRNGN